MKLKPDSKYVDPGADITTSIWPVVVLLPIVPKAKLNVGMIKIK